jgi:hypothetical protein
MPEGFNDKNKTLLKNDANGSGDSAVVIASRGASRKYKKLDKRNIRKFEI